MSQTNQRDAPLFQVGNHHSANCGPPPHIHDVGANQYLGYFENQYGEQAVFIYDYAANKAVCSSWAMLAGRPNMQWSTGRCPI